jgi:hypothetical protein
MSLSLLNFLSKKKFWEKRALVKERQAQQSSKNISRKADIMVIHAKSGGIIKN